jgi:hypothetical protein
MEVFGGNSLSSIGSALGCRPPGRAIDPVSGVCFIKKFASVTQVAPRPKYSLISATPGLKQHSSIYGGVWNLAESYSAFHIKRAPR